MPSVKESKGQFLCQVSRDAQFFRNALSEKDHRPRGSVEGRLHVNIAVLIGCQMSADWHARLRLTALPTGGSFAPCRHGRSRNAQHRDGGAVVDRTQCGTDGDSRFQELSENGNASSPPVLTTAPASSTYVWTRAGMPTQQTVRAAT